MTDLIIPFILLKRDYKMSIFSGLNTMLSSLSSAIDREKDRLERDVDSVISNMSSGARKEFDGLFMDISDFLSTTGEGVKKDFETLEKLFDEMEQKIENASLKAVHGFVDKAENEVVKIERSVNTTLREVQKATNYIRTEAYDETIKAVDSARDDIKKLKDNFEAEIIKISKDIIQKTKEGIEFIKSGAENDISKLNHLREEIDGEIENKFTDVKQMLVKTKNTAEKELDNIASLVRSEVEVLEKRIKSVSETATTLMNYIAITLLIVGGVGAIGIILYKERRETLKMEMMKCEKPV